jgi:hypothetical protein
MKYFSCQIPFGKKEVYAKEVKKASLERLARLIKVCGFLLQTKVTFSGSLDKAGELTMFLGWLQDLAFFCGIKRGR